MRSCDMKTIGDAANP